MLLRLPVFKAQARPCRPSRPACAHSGPNLGRTSLHCRASPESKPGAATADTAGSVYRVTFQNVTREVTHSQLERAPDSLLSKILLHGDDSSGVQTRTFSVTYQNVTRELTAVQLNKAADSPLSSTLLHCGLENAALILSPFEAHNASLPAWRNGSECLFEICMDCYTGTSSASHSSIAYKDQLPSAEALRSAVVDFFKIPSHLWPLGFHVQFKALENEIFMRKRAQELLSTCAEAMKADMMLRDGQSSTAITVKVVKCRKFMFAKVRGSSGADLGVKSYEPGSGYNVYAIAIPAELKHALQQVAESNFMQATFELMGSGPDGMLKMDVMQLQCMI